MKNIVKKSLFILAACLVASSVWGASIYKTDLVASPTGATTSGDKGEFVAAPSWASGYTQCYHTTGSAGAVTINFTTPINLSAYTNCKFSLAWGAESNRPVNLSINGSSATEIDKVASSSERSQVRIATANLSVTSISSIKLSGSGGGNSYYLQFEITGDAAGPSTDATLKSIVYGGDLTPVPNFSPDKLEYEVVLPATYVGGAPSVQATANDAAATVDITPATTLPGTAKIVVTAEDGTTTKTYTVSFIKESANPKVETATWANILGTATIDNINLTITGKVTNGSSLTLTPTFTGKYIDSWTPDGAQDFSTGAINYTFKSATDETTTYAVTIIEAPAVSSDATLSDLRYDNKTVPGFSPDMYNYTIELPAGTTTAPVLLAFANDSHATKEYTQAGSVPGVGKVVVTAEDGITKLTYTVNFTVAVPPSDLTTHVPEKYEAKDIAGGYNTPLTVFDGHEYEVYFATRDADSKFCVATTNADKTASITTRGSGEYDCAANDGWFKMSGTGWSSTSDAMGDEFGTMARRLDVDATCEFSLRFSGFDQFAIVARDKKKDTSSDQTKPEDNRYLEVYIDGVLQPQQFNTNPSIRRYNTTSSVHEIKIKHIGTEKSAIYAFSLRVSQEPRTKWLMGNDSTQTVYARGTIKPVTYFTKYNAKGETKLEWLGNEAPGITLAIDAHGELGDTLSLTGTADCPAGEYHYAVVAYYNSAETSRAEGKFKVINHIEANTDTVIDAYENEEMDEIICKYYVYDEAQDIIFKWDTNDGAPGITTTAKNGKFIISGTPTVVGNYSYVLTVKDGDTITGRINVKPLDLGNNPVMYLYKNNMAYEKDGVYQYLKGMGRNLIERKTKSDLRSPDQYNKYKWILISEDVDANNPEVFKIIHGGTNIPVLNMKAFSYAHPIDSLTEEWGGIWGEADNGSISENGKSITVLRDDHPIFKALNKKKGDKIQVLDSIDKRGLMPIRVTKAGSLCLATALTRNMEDYYGDGEEQTFLHEIPAELTGRAKYICLPISKSSSQYLTQEGKNLINKTIEYLLSNDKSVSIPDLRMISFAVNGIAATPNEANSTFRLDIDTTKYHDIDLTAVVPDIQLASAYTHTEPAMGDTVDLSIAQYIPIEYVVTDYITRRVYEISVRLYKPQGIEDVYSVGEWVNVYDIFGRKIATTNENIYTMALPRGVYIIVMENGHTLKITK